MSLGNLFNLDNNNNNATLLILFVIAIIILGFGRTEVCGYNFGCFNPANVAPLGVGPTAVSPETLERDRDRRCCKPCCKPCCNPCYNQCSPCGGGCGGGLFGGNSWCFIILIVALIFILGKPKHKCCDECDD